MRCVNFEMMTMRIEMKKKQKVMNLQRLNLMPAVVWAYYHYVYISSHNRIEEKKVNVQKFKYQIVLFHFVELVENV